jgi:RNA polymerase sigma factor (sigma-70 family)
MKYAIHNKHLIEPESQQKFFEEEVQKKIKRLEKDVSHLEQEKKGNAVILNVDIFIKKEGKRLYSISVSLSLKGKTLVLEDKGEIPMLVVNELLDKLRRQLRDHLAIRRREYLYKRKNRQSAFMIENMDRLSSYRKKDERESFVQLLTQLLPSIRSYIQRRLEMAKATGLNKNGVLTLDDLADETYTRVFELFDTKPDIAENLLPWVYQAADAVLNERLGEIDFEKMHITGLGKITKAEIKSMEEEFTADADPDLVMMEELDDPSYNTDQFNPVEILKDNADEEIIGKVDQEQAHEMINRTLAAIPVLERSVFDLYWLERMRVEEIAFIKRIPEKEVEKILANATKIITRQLKTLAGSTEESPLVS